MALAISLTKSFTLNYLAIIYISVSLGQSDTPSFAIDFKDNTFVKDGKPFRLVSGSIHYFRSPEAQWGNLLRKMRLGGLNAISTYVPWGLHQPDQSLQFDFNGNLNLFKFLTLAQQNNLLVVLRQSPFIDAEFDMGGLPPWLLWAKPGINLRTSDLDFNYYVGRWYDQLLPMIRPFLFSQGGPIVLMQVENEYGSYGCDKNYTSFLRDLIRFHLGNEVILFTNDGVSDGMVRCGSISGAYPTLDFGPGSRSQINASFALQRKFAPRGPLLNAEFYPGWLDHWRKPHSKTDSEIVAKGLDYILSVGANVNIYMYHGGTSFGFSSGANVDGNVYEACPTSYDYDAPINEAGEPTEKYFAIKEVISKYVEVPSENPVVTPKGAYGKVMLQQISHVTDMEFLTLFSRPRTKSLYPLSFEELKVGSGFVLYEKRIDFLPTDPILLSAPHLKDRAYVYIDDVFVAVLSRTEHIFSTSLVIREGQILKLLVENTGRVCFGHSIGESKGLGENVTLGTTVLQNWIAYPLGELDGKKLSKFSHIGAKNDGGVVHQRNLGGEAQVSNWLSIIRNRGSGTFFAGNFTLPMSADLPLDTFVRLDGFSKGYVWANGINLGRYWPVVGPQETLYLPSSFMQPYPKVNTLVILELEQAPGECTLSEEVMSQIGMKIGSSCHVKLTETHVIDAKTPYSVGVARPKNKFFNGNYLRREFFDMSEN